VIIAVTGADGFIGKNLCATLERRGQLPARIVRANPGPGSDRRVVGDLANFDALECALAGADSVVHLAARAHVLRGTAPEPGTAYSRMNVEATVRLAEAAVRAGVRRFVFVSSIGVNGGQSGQAPFREANPPAPVEPYARSKLEAEGALRLLAERSGLEIVIVRPPMVYGPGVKGNLLRLLSLVDSGIPLPLASVSNRRSLIGVENLADLLALCVERSAAAGQLFLAAEPDTHSTPALMGAIARAMGRPSRLFGFPPGALRIVARLVGLEDQFGKICGSLEVSADKARQVLGWEPRLSFDEGIARMVHWYRKRRDE
jgi:nucleoside-diphosphate-sugar epimerase